MPDSADPRPEARSRRRISLLTSGTRVPSLPCTPDAAKENPPFGSGRVEGDFLAREGEPVFRERRTCMEAMAPLSRTLRERFGDAIELQVVDPRNPVLVFLLLRDFWAFRVGLVEALKTIGGLPIQAVVLNGQLLSRGEWPDPLEVVQILEEAISTGALQSA